MVTLSGTGTADAEVCVYDIESGAEATTIAGPDGTFTVDYPLADGINRLAVEATVDGVTSRSWVGTNIELEMVPALMQSLPRGATIDIVRVP